MFRVQRFFCGRRRGGLFRLLIRFVVRGFLRFFCGGFGLLSGLLPGFFLRLIPGGGFRL